MNAGGRGDDEPSLCGEDPHGKMSSGVGTISLHPGKPSERGQLLFVVVQVTSIERQSAVMYCFNANTDI